MVWRAIDVANCVFSKDLTLGLCSFFCQTELVFAKGQARLQQNTARRNKHNLEITAGLHRGPDNVGQFLQTSEKMDRPMVCFPCLFLLLCNAM